jgi:hypothetical protein
MANRIWVLDIAGDSAFADIFLSEAFIGRLAVACPEFDG